MGAGIRKQIKELLLLNKDVLDNLRETPKDIPSLDTEEINRRLDRLESSLTALIDESNGNIGHNNPPEPIDKGADLVAKAIEELKDTRLEASKQQPDSRIITESKNSLIELGLKLLTWTGDRITDTAKAASIATGTGLGVWFSAGLGGKIVETLRALSQLVPG